MAAIAGYIPNKREGWYWLPSVASETAPTTAEFGAGQELSINDTTIIAEVAGFTSSANTVEAPSINTTFTAKFSGTSTADDSSITFYKSSKVADVNETIRALLVEGSVGYIARIHPVNSAKVAPASTVKTEIWPVQITANNVLTPASGELAKFKVDFAVMAPPTKAAVIA